MTENNQENKYNKLTEEEEKVILQKGTEMPFTGMYYKHNDKGTYICKRCNAPLYKSDDKFDSGCGWPGFDDEIPGAVKKIPDADGLRTEILCANCGGHLGHVFEGERFTEKNTRHCVNSISLNFIPDIDSIKTKNAIFAAGCFWGVEYYFKKLNGVISTTVGYTGGNKENPTYNEVCSDNTGHAEAIEIEYNPDVVSYEKLAKYFFEIHDFTQIDRQGPDIGEQYRTAIFYSDNEQKKIADSLISVLNGKGYQVATTVEKASTFWSAEDYHQDYYDVKGSTPYCHVYRKIFD